MPLPAANTPRISLHLFQLTQLSRLSLLKEPSDAEQRQKLKQDLASTLAFARMVEADAAHIDDSDAPSLWQGDLPLSLCTSHRLPRAEELPDEASTLHTLRDDAVEGLLPQDTLLANAPACEHGFFSVPKTVDR